MSFLQKTQNIIILLLYYYDRLLTKPLYLQPTSVGTFIHTCIRIAQPTPISLSHSKTTLFDVKKLAAVQRWLYQHPSALFPRQRCSLRSLSFSCYCCVSHAHFSSTRRPRGNGGAVLTALRCNCGEFKKQRRERLLIVFFDPLFVRRRPSRTPRAHPIMRASYFGWDSANAVLIFGRRTIVLGSRPTASFLLYRSAYCERKYGG